MGGAVSSGRDNNELIDNLMGGNYIRTREVERVFRALDRADYMTPEARDQAYKDLAWRNGPLHMSAPCIYSEVMEGLELKPGLSFLNVGSGTGYLSTLVGLIIGSSGISHGVEVNTMVVEYATKKLSQFMENSPTLDEFDFCEPKFYSGNGLSLAPLLAPYDRVYCGAGCPEEYENYFRQLIKVGGILVMPLNDNLLQVRRTGAAEWSSRTLLSVSFAALRVPAKEEAQDLLRLEEQCPVRLQALSRAVVRRCMRGAMRRRHPALREPPPRAPPAKKACPRRICIPVDDDSDAEGLNALHDLDPASGATEMNALLSLVLSMGHNRVAGALRVDTFDSPTDSDSDSDDNGPDDNNDDRPDNDSGAVADANANRCEDLDGSHADDDDHEHGDYDDSEDDDWGPHSGSEGDRNDSAGRPRDIIMIGFRNMPTRRRDSTPPALPTDGADTSHPKQPTEESPSSSSPTKDKEPKDYSRHKKLFRRRASRGSQKESKDEQGENPDVPAEVEIYLGKSREAPGTSTMEWEPAEGKQSSEEDTTEMSSSKAKEEKRQKLDSGVGEENTPSAGSSTHTSKSEQSDSTRSDTHTDEGCDEETKGRRRRQKRSHLSARSSSSSEGEAGAGAGAGAEAGAEAGAAEDPRLARAARRRRRRLRTSYDARRVSLSLRMKRGVKELPLPHALKKYVNLGRCFEF